MCDIEGAPTGQGTFPEVVGEWSQESDAKHWKRMKRISGKRNLANLRAE